MIQKKIVQSDTWTQQGERKELLRNKKRRNSRREKTKTYLPINIYETGNMLEKEGQINTKN